MLSRALPCRSATCVLSEPRRQRGGPACTSSAVRSSTSAPSLLLPRQSSVFRGKYGELGGGMSSGYSAGRPQQNRGLRNVSRRSFGLPEAPDIDEDLVFGTGLLGILAAIVFIFAGQPVVSIPAGSAAAIDFFGSVSEETIPQGIHLKRPFAVAHPFSLKTQLVEVTQDVPTSEGLIVELDVSILFKIEPEAVRPMYQTVGSNYKQVLVLPEVQSVVRSLTSQYSAKALYSEGRNQLSQGIVDQLNHKLNGRGVTVEEALLRKVTLPNLVTRAIESKLKAEQESEQMEFVLIKEKQEAERKRIEAKGIADFQAIVSEGINEELLQWKGIEATELLAQSPNSKVVVIGNNKNGLPLILGDGPSDDSSEMISRRK